MLKRKIEAKLLQWKNDKNKMPLIIKGCRQCGKTSSVLEFAKKYYKKYVYINFLEKPEYKSLFEGSLETKDIISKMSSLYSFDTNVENEPVLIILDEIQNCGNARTSLKFFKLEGRYDVIATGSLLGVKNVGDEIASIPVGYEETIEMMPLDFEEYLWANGVKQNTIDYLYNCFTNCEVVNEATHNRMNEIIQNYMIVGGMPKVVDEYIKNKSLDKVLNIQKNIINDYRDDVVKYALRKDKTKILECFDSITKQLSKENKKFQYSVVRKGSKAKEYDGCLEWLVDAGIIKKCYNLSSLELPLEGTAINDCFKIYMADIGLLVSMFEEGIQFDIINNNLLRYKGALYENLAADILNKMRRKLYYYKKQSGLEIDFVIRYNNKCTPIEVKAQTGNSRSLSAVINNDKNDIEVGMKFGNYNVGFANNIKTYPWYMMFLLNKQ